MANQEQLAILKQGVDVWNKWRKDNRSIKIKLDKVDLNGANLSGIYLSDANLRETNLAGADLSGAVLSGTNLAHADLSGAKLFGADLAGVDLMLAKLMDADLGEVWLWGANIRRTNLAGANLTGASLSGASLREADLNKTNFSNVEVSDTIFANSNLSEAIGLEDVVHKGPASISTDTFAFSKGKIPEVFLRGCGLSDADIEYVKLFNPDLSNDEINKILYRIYDLRAMQAFQISPLFISYSHGDVEFVDKIEHYLNIKGIRFWRDIHDAKAGRLEKQIDKAIRQNPTVLLVLSEHSLQSDWVQHEVRAARDLEKELGRDILCPVTLDDNWKNSGWPKRVMEQVMEYNILDFSEWKDDGIFENRFNKLIDGLGLFYK